MILFNACLLVFLAGLPAAAQPESNLRLRPPLWVDPDDRPIPRPKERMASELYALVYNSWLRHLSPEYKALLASDKGALNVSAWDEAPDSSWFTNRVGRRAMTFGELANGLAGKSPEPGSWKVTGNTDEGYTPKLFVRDGAGRRYVLKFDLPDNPERNSAAERIGTLIMHAAGYHVAHDSIAYFRAGDLLLDEKAVYRDAVGNRRKMTPADLKDAFAKLKPLPDGRYRGLASQFIAGEPLGKFMYAGVRQDDPNDLIPHELRRELRGLRVIASWINHVDVGDKNAHDAYAARGDGGRFVKHYLLDFGSTLGSGDFFNGPYRVGHEYLFDGPAVARSLLTLGFWRRPWEVQGKILYPEVGYFQAELFEPDRWKPNYPNLSFERMDDADAYWGAKIVTAFSDDTIRRIVSSGEYSRAEAAAYVAEVLNRRRDAIGRFWLDKITPLEEIVLDSSGGKDRLRFRDLAVERGYADAGARTYQFWTEDLRGRKLSAVKTSTGGAFVAPIRLDIATREAKPDRYGRTAFLRVLIQSNRRDGRWARPIEVIVGEDSHGPEVLGWSHAAR